MTANSINTGASGENIDPNQDAKISESFRIFVFTDGDIQSVLLGGAANMVFHVSKDREEMVVKIPGYHQNILNPLCHFEPRNSLLASKTGVVPNVLFIDDKSQTMVSKFIHGVAPDLDYLQSSEGLKATSRALKAFHQSPLFPNDFSAEHLIHHYLQVIDRCHLTISSEVQRATILALKLTTLLEQNCQEKVPCHNDAMPKNWILDQDNNLWLIDLEFSGNNDPAFDLATLWNESCTDVQLLRTLIRNYSGMENPLLVARTWLQSLVVDGLWSAYAEIQSQIGPFQDFYSSKKIERATKCISKTKLSMFTECYDIVGLY